MINDCDNCGKSVHDQTLGDTYACPWFYLQPSIDFVVRGECPRWIPQKDLAS